MAKITARGDRELARWESQDGYGLILTHQGRLLRRFTSNGGWNVLMPKATMTQAERMAQGMGATKR